MSLQEQQYGVRTIPVYSIPAVLNSRSRTFTVCFLLWSMSVTYGYYERGGFRQVQFVSVLL